MRELFIPQNSVIHTLDARVKLLFTLGFILFLNLAQSRTWSVFFLFLSLVLSLVLLSRLGLGLVLKRSLLVTPFLLAALPLLFTMPGPQLETVLGIQVSQAGLLRFLSIAFRSWLSVFAAVLLTATTRFTDLLTALQQLRVPALFIAIIRLMYRYLFVMVDQARRMLNARSSRSAFADGQRHSGGTLTWRARVTGGMAGSLFLRSIERSERVYAAMLSRGYDGTLPVSERIPLSRREKEILTAGLVLVLLLFILSLFLRG